MNKKFVVICDNCGFDCSDAYYNDGEGNKFCSIKCKKIFVSHAKSEGGKK